MPNPSCCGFADDDRPQLRPLLLGERRRAAGRLTCGQRVGAAGTVGHHPAHDGRARHLEGARHVGLALAGEHAVHREPPQLFKSVAVQLPGISLLRHLGHDGTTPDQLHPFRNQE